MILQGDCRERMADQDLFREVHFGITSDGGTAFGASYARRHDLRKVVRDRPPFCLAGCRHLVLVESIAVRYEEHPLFGNWYAKETVTPDHCMKFREVGAWRQEIFSRAYNESWDEYDRRMEGESKVTSHKQHFAQKARAATHDRIAAEYIDCKRCPFFEPPATLDDFAP